ncbi:MAG: lysophospholipid acyltransferase family protein [Tumebacillaceae bacterium]
MLYRFGRSICRAYFRVFHNYQYVDVKNVPDQGSVLLVSNHISNLDPPLVGSPIDRQVRFMAKDELFKVPVLGWLLRGVGAFPVKRGAGDRNALRTVFKILDDGEVLGMFPEGTRSKSGELEEAHTGAAAFALRSKATLIPVAIVGRYKLFRSIKVVYGKPVDLSEFYGQKTSKEVLYAATHKIMDAIEQLIEEHRS